MPDDIRSHPHFTSPLKLKLSTNNNDDHSPNTRHVGKLLKPNYFPIEYLLSGFLILKFLSLDLDLFRSLH